MTAPRVIEVDVELVVRTRQQLKQDVLAALDAGARAIVLDFTHTRNIDSSGLGVLVSIGKAVRDAGGTLTLRGMSDELRDVFWSVRLDTLFTFEPAPVPATT